MALIKCTECGKEISDKATTCPNCGAPVNILQNDSDMNTDTNIDLVKEPTDSDITTAEKAVNKFSDNPSDNNHSNDTKGKSSWLSIIAFMLSVFGCGILSFFGAILAIIDIAKNGKTNSKKLSIAAICIFFGWILLISSFGNDKDTDNSTDSTIESTTEETKQTAEEATTEEITQTTEATTEEITQTTEAATEEVVQEEDFKNSCESISYKDLLRNPDDYIGKNIKIDLKIAQVGISGGLFNDVEYMRAYSNDEYDMWVGDVYVLTDGRTDDNTKILVDDIISVYGTFTGNTEFEMALTGTTEEYPVIDIKYMDLIEE